MATTSDLLLILTVFHGSLCDGLIYEDNLCSGDQNCHQNQSGLCQIKFPSSCSDQLTDLDSEDGDCLIERIEPSECYIEAPSYVSKPNELPFGFEMYHYKTWMQFRPIPNLTFFASTWQSVKFQYQGRENKSQVLCRRFSLVNVSRLLSSSLFWDCPIFKLHDYLNHSFDLSVITSEGRGGQYAFRIPERKRFDPINTRLKDWQVFFFMHLGHVQWSTSLPITIQLAPFENIIAYNISLLKCLKEENPCNKYSLLSSTQKTNSEELGKAIHVGATTKQFTLLLTSWNAPATYAVSVQIISSECPDQGCFVSVSPVFEIKEGQLALWLCIAFGFVLIFIFAFTVTIHHRIKENRNLVLALNHNPATVLLLYLPENDLCLDVVKAFSKYLKDTCYVQPYVVDLHVGSQNPNSWTSEHMNNDSHLLFLIPGNPHGDSVTPIRDQWIYALRYLLGHHFSTHHLTERVATVLLPFSADIPKEIAHVQRFSLIKDMTSLVTWIHNGSWLDKKLLWEPQVQSSLRSTNVVSLTELAQLVDQASQVTKCHHKDVRKVFHKESYTVESNHSAGKDSGIPPSINLLNNADQCKTYGPPDELNDVVLTCEYKDEFDVAILDVQDLLIDDTETRITDGSDRSSQHSDLDDSLFL